MMLIVHYGSGQGLVTESKFVVKQLSAIFLKKDIITFIFTLGFTSLQNRCNCRPVDYCNG